MILGQDHVKQALKVAVDTDTPILLVGETGSGKTSLVRELAEEHQKPFVRFNMTGETSVDDFVGKYTLRKKETLWQDGLLLQAMKAGAWLVVDEINVALPDILLVMNSLLDDDRRVTVAAHDGEIVEAHQDFRFFATMNPTDEYSGTKELNKAFLSRFGMVQQVEYPSAQIEIQILQEAGVKPDDARAMVAIAGDIRGAKRDGEVYYTCSTRDLLHWGNLLDNLDFQRAFKLAVVNKSPNDAKTLQGIYKANEGDWKQLAQLKAKYSITDELVKIRELADREAKLRLRDLEIEELQRDLHKAKKLYDKAASQIKHELAIEVQKQLRGHLVDIGSYLDSLA